MQTANVAGTTELDHTWIALNQAVGGLDEFDANDPACRCALIERAGRALVIEAAEARNALRVSVRESRGDNLKDHMAWIVRFADEFRGVANVADAKGKPINRRGVARLNDVLWRFHRLAVEDRAGVIRS